VLALIGIFLIMAQGTQLSWPAFWDHLNGNLVAYILALVAAVSWALYSNLTRRSSPPGSGGAVELFILVTGLVLLAIRLLTTEPTGWKLAAVGEVAALAAITTLAYSLWHVTMRKGNLLLVVAYSYFTPLFSTLVRCAYLGVSPSSTLWAGCGLPVAGSLLSWTSMVERAKAGKADHDPGGQGGAKGASKLPHSTGRSSWAAVRRCS
jgi:drug/metabolite transporter (DMT)-like permease